jgi:hypothetical protein
METAQIFLLYAAGNRITPTPVQVSTNTPVRKCAFKSWDNAPITDSTQRDRQVPPKIMPGVVITGVDAIQEVDEPSSQSVNQYGRNQRFRNATSRPVTTTAFRCGGSGRLHKDAIEILLRTYVHSRGRGLSDRFGNV